MTLSKKNTIIISIVIVMLFLVSGCSSKEIDDTTKRNIDSINEIMEKEEESSLTELKSNTGVDGDIFSNRLAEMSKNKHYTMVSNTKGNFEGKETDIKTTVVVDGDDWAVIIESDYLSVTNMVKGDKAYVILHDKKTVVVDSIPDNMEAPGVHQIEDNKLAYLEKGKDVFLGKERNYEDYKTDDGIEVRYYFDGEELVGMEKFSDGKSTIPNLQLYPEVDKSMFKLPKTYKEIKGT